MDKPKSQKKPEVMFNCHHCWNPTVKKMSAQKYCIFCRNQYDKIKNKIWNYIHHKRDEKVIEAEIELSKWLEKDSKGNSDSWI